MEVFAPDVVPSEQPASSVAVLAMMASPVIALAFAAVAAAAVAVHSTAAVTAAAIEHRAAPAQKVELSGKQTSVTATATADSHSPTLSHS